ncbi:MULTISPECIES: DUF6339 family protein [unclassified Enterococcus]|uniref:DUF6339 family protein n=1 Tax=unclassified Enterococcus TaxID=2608891 RepID=UPI001CE0BCC8|nr:MULTISPECIES: DUF6339 family protein [unclassified Enterococcus]MCA5011773.1 hypothetical protein [Enterococcus sp. S23]MCA5014785.1 hypothetical protein [Enterococcus sp. S22(2020)]
MNNIEIVKSESLQTIKNNLPILERCFYYEDNHKFLEFFKDDYPFTNSKIELENFDLIMNNEKPFFTELENVKRVYNRLKFLTDSQASDERLWAGLCITRFWEYTKYRWKIKSSSDIENHFFFGYGARRSLTRNALSRLWWIGRLSYDETRKNPYELTELLCENSNYIQDVLERNTSNNSQITRAFLTAILQLREENIVINKRVMAELSKYLNLLGGTYLLDCMDMKTIELKIFEKGIQLYRSEF